jgi:CDP-diacylglycerol--glycerol-3-phosphate 3-phosphatidyltransferase
VTDRLLTLPNLLSGLRFVIAPALLWLAWTQRPTAFLALVAVSFLSDILDGWVARRLGQVTALGARLDTAGDVASYLSIPVCGWWLWPQRLQPELPYLLVLAVSYAAPFAFGFVRYRDLASHHTWGGRISAWILGSTALLLIAGGSPWPFRAAVVIVVLADIEEIAISAIAPRDACVPTLWHALRDRRARAAPR